MAYEAIRIRPVTPHIGAEISGVDLAAPTAAQKDEIRRALIDRKVIVFRDQAISAVQYAAFMYLFGTPVREDLVTDEGRPPEVGAIHIRQREPQRINYWHMDHSFREKPTPVLSLHAKVLPECGGDTLFASLEAAYDGLSDAMKSRIQGLETYHRVTETQNSRRRYTEEQFAAMLAAPPVKHPLVGFNPDNGRKYLFVNVPLYCRSIVGMETPEGDALLRELYLHAQRPEFQMRLVWQPKTLAVWENCHCLHYPVADYFPHERKMWRVVIQAERRPMAAPA